MAHVHIYAPQSWLGRTVRYCSTCRARRRFVVRLYEWHPSDWLCCGCGHKFISGGGRVWAGKKELRENQKEFRELWMSIPSLHTVIEKMMRDIK